MSGARAVCETTNLFRHCPCNHLKLPHFLADAGQQIKVLRWRNLIALLFRPVLRCFEQVASMSRR
jgi:hypothetical protein